MKSESISQGRRLVKASKTLRKASIVFLGGVFATTTPAKAQEAHPAQHTQSHHTPENWKAYWNKGYHIESDDGIFNMKFGGRLMYDMAFFFQDDTIKSLVGAQNNGTEFRRLRFYNSGTIYRIWEYKLELDWAGGKVALRDAYIETKKVPLIGHFRVGHFKEPFSLEELTSSNHITFMERALPNAFVPSRNPGLMAYNFHLNGRLGWFAGVFRDGNNSGDAPQADNGYALTGRLYLLPIHNKEKNLLVEVGGAVSYRMLDPRNYQVKAKPESHLANTYANSGVLTDVSPVVLTGAEAALVWGPLSLQGELISSQVTQKLPNRTVTHTFMGYYGYMSYFITGEHRPFKKGSFSGIEPRKYLHTGGPGAWEVALRYSHIDLISGSATDNTLVNGGTLSDITVGVNWYPEPSIRFMLNWVYTMLSEADQNGVVKRVGKASIVEMRAQVYF